jgi:hypothetical protein
MIRGEHREAAALAGRLRRALPGTNAAARLELLDALYAAGDSTVARLALRELLAATGDDAASVPVTSESWAANRCVLAQWNAARGDTASLGRAIAALRRAPHAIPSIVVGASPAACAELLEATRAVVARRADARGRVARLDSLAWTPQVVGDLALYAPLAIARLHERLGDVPGALAALRRQGYLWGWPRYQAVVAREVARLEGGARAGAR